MCNKHLYEYNDQWSRVRAIIDEEKRDLIVDTILHLYEKIGFHAESIIQGDVVYLEAPVILAELADKLSFTVEYNDEMHT